MSDVGAHDVVSFGPFVLYPRERRLERDGEVVKIGSRALDILIVLTASAGEVVSKEALLAKVWPETVVEESGLRVHVAGLRKVLGDGREGARYVTNVPGRGYSFVAQTSRSETVPQPELRRTPIDRGHKTPPQHNRLIGRDEVVRDIAEQLLATRFVSIVGPGGMGKTTVAVAVAHALAEEFAGDVCFVDLGSLSDSAPVASSVAAALGLTLQNEEAIPGLVASLQLRRALLVLDNCEHVIEAIAPLAEKIFTRSPEVYVLTTSREPLRCDGEHVHRLMPLDGPAGGDGITATEAASIPSVQLFLERAAAGGARLTLTDVDAPVLAMICIGLDGIPLAIEFAASRVEAYGLRGVAASIESRVKLMWQGRRTALPRHQTLGSMLDWSYELLTEQERTTMRRLSVFVGTFSLEAGIAVVCDTNVDRELTAEVIGSLVEKSLISLEPSHDTPRYRMLETTRAYAQTKLEEAGELAQTARRHATYLCNVLDDPSDVATPRDHLSNVRAALKWSSSAGGDARLCAALTAAATRLFVELSLLSECLRWAQTALRSLDEHDRDTRTELVLQTALGVSMMFTRGNSDEALAALKRGLALAVALGEPYHQLRVLGALVVFHDRIGDFHQSVALAKQSDLVADRLRDPEARAISDWMIGASLHLVGEQTEAVRRCRSAITARPSSPRLYSGFDHRIRALVALGRAMWLVGRPDEAMSVATQAVQEGGDSGQSVGVAMSGWASSVFLWSGDFTRAEEVIERLLSHTKQHLLGPYHFIGLGLKGDLAVKQGRPADGLLLLRQALEVSQRERHGLLETVFLTALGEAQGVLGHHTDAIASIDQAIALSARDGGSYDLAEVLRVKATLVAAGPNANVAEAESYLIRSLDVAGSQGALGWQLRSATTMARLWIGQGRVEEARRMLSSSYELFREGFETADLVAARLLLAQP